MQRLSDCDPGPSLALEQKVLLRHVSVNAAELENVVARTRERPDFDERLPSSKIAVRAMIPRSSPHEDGGNSWIWTLNTPSPTFRIVLS